MEWIGYASAILHLSLINTFIVLVGVSHTLYPALWLKIVLFIAVLLIFIQHIVIGGCIMTFFEKGMSNQDDGPHRKILEKILGSFGVTMEQHDTYFLAVLGTSVLWMGLEIVSIISSRLN